MATIKSYTDLSQSKKLAEILPIESADMHYCLENRDVVTGYEIGIVPFIKARRFKCNIVDIQPAWSLAALLEVLPKTINFGYENYSTFVLKPLENGKYLADYYDVALVKDNPVDACYELILKLNELNLL